MVFKWITILGMWFYLQIIKYAKWLWYQIGYNNVLDNREVGDAEIFVCFQILCQAKEILDRKEQNIFKSNVC